MLRFVHYLNQDRHEKGFTLIELLVVMIIIGILAAIAIPIFLNQQKTSRDVTLKSDMRNVATAVEEALVRDHDAQNFAISARDSSGKVTLTVGNATAKAKLSKGTVLALTMSDEPGTFKIFGWNPDSKSYTTKALVYDSARGGFQRDLAAIPSGPNSQNPGAGSGETPNPEPSTPTEPSPGETTPPGGTTPTEPALAAPGEPTNVKLTASTSGTAKVYNVTWDAPTTGGAVVDYDVTVRAMNAGKSIIDTAAAKATTTSATVTKTWTTAPATVQAVVVANNATGSSSPVISPETITAVSDPNKPVITEVTYNPTTKQVTVKWLPPTTSSMAASYRIASTSHDAVTNKWASIGVLSTVYPSSTRSATFSPSGLTDNTDIIRVYVSPKKSDGTSGVEVNYELRIK